MLTKVRGLVRLVVQRPSVAIILKKIAFLQIHPTRCRFRYSINTIKRQISLILPKVTELEIISMKRTTHSKFYCYSLHHN